MGDDERQDEQKPEDAGSDPSSDDTAAPAEETPAEPDQGQEEVPPEEPHPDEPSTEEAPPDDKDAEEDAAPEDAPEAEAKADDAAEEKPKAKDAPPGAELEPIALEPERELSAEERARAEAEAEERARAEAEATAESAEDEPVASGPTVELPADARIQATGKRKSSIARVVVRPGGGGFEINSRSLEEYFPRHQHQTMARQPLVTTGYEESLDVSVRVHGGGISGQAGAVRNGVAKALTEIDGELRPELKRRGLLTRDARRKERRKAGLKKARKRPQFSKR